MKLDTREAVASKLASQKDLTLFFSSSYTFVNKIYSQTGEALCNVSCSPLAGDIDKCALAAE